MFTARHCTQSLCVKVLYKEGQGGQCMQVRCKYTGHAWSLPHFYKQSSEYSLNSYGLSNPETIHEIIVRGLVMERFVCEEEKTPKGRHLHLLTCLRNCRDFIRSLLNCHKWNAYSTSLHLHKMIAFSSLCLCTIQIYFGVIRPSGRRFVQS